METIFEPLVDKGTLSEYIDTNINMYKEKHTLEKRCKQLENVLKLYDFNIDEFHIMAYKNPYLYIIESKEPRSKITVEGNAALIEFFGERQSMLYNFITCRYIMC